MISWTSHPLQINIDVTVIGTNDFSPAFNSSTYSINLTEYDSINGRTPIQPNQVVTTVHATDRDGTGTAAGRLEYRILSGATQFGVLMFSIPDPTVSQQDNSH